MRVRSRYGRDAHGSIRPTFGAGNHCCTCDYINRFLLLPLILSMVLSTDECADAPGMRQALRGVGVISLEPRTDEPGNTSADASMFDFLVDPGMYRDVEEVVRTFPG